MPFSSYGVLHFRYLAVGAPIFARAYAPAFSPEVFSLFILVYFPKMMMSERWRDVLHVERDGEIYRHAAMPRDAPSCATRFVIRYH